MLARAISVQFLQRSLLIVKASCCRQSMTACKQETTAEITKKKNVVTTFTYLEPL